MNRQEQTQLWERVYRIQEQLDRLQEAVSSLISEQAALKEANRTIYIKRDVSRRARL